MSIFNRRKKVETKANQFEEVLMRLIAAREGLPGEMVTPKSCLAAPTIHAIDTAVNRRLSVTPLHVYSKGRDENGREVKIKQPDHPVAKLLRRPNQFQTSTDFWADAASTWLRYGRYYAYKSQSGSGKLFDLIPMAPESVEPKVNDRYQLKYEVQEEGGKKRYEANKVFHARGRARNFLEGDSPIKHIQTAIMMEILAEKFGESFFRNGAMPLQMFQYMEGFGQFENEQDEAAFIESFKSAFGGAKRFNAMIVPFGMEVKDPVRLENDKAQFIESRKYQRTVIAGALGVPPHLVGDLERATFNNVEQQDSDFTLNVIMPVCKSFEAAIERDLLTEEDRNSGIVVRFNLDATLRASFKERQEGLQIQRQNSVISANEWREIEGRNPVEGGDEYWTQGPSGQGMGNA